MLEMLLVVGCWYSSSSEIENILLIFRVVIKIVVTSSLDNSKSLKIL